MIYRIGEKGDATNLWKVIDAALGAHGLELEKTGADADVSDVEKYYMNNGGWFQVVEEDGEIIGSVGVYKINDTVCELRKMYLYPKYQGRGIGKTLMENALQAAKKLGFKEMVLQTSSKLVKALPIYDKYGFVNDENGEICSRCDIAMKRDI